MFIGGNNEQNLYILVQENIYRKSYHSFYILALMHATIFGNVASIISRMYSKRQEYDKKVLDLEHFVKVHKLPKNLKQR